MSNIIEKIKKFVSHWYLRFLLATELYMVEPWEQAIIHSTFSVIFLLYWYFNYSIVMHGIAHFRGTAMTAG